MYIFAMAFIALAAFIAGDHFGSAAVRAVETELSKVEETASTDVKLLAAKIKALL